MTDNVLARLFEHHNWANARMIEVCSTLTDEQLEAQPKSVTKGSIRRTLEHLVNSQQGYLRTLTGIEPRFDLKGTRSFPDLREAARLVGEDFLAIARDEAGKMPKTPRQTRDGYLVEPWVLMLQVLNHGAEHREQISSMLTDLGLTPPDLDGWSYAEFTKAMRPPQT
jgi:uncharacterized damage-inducible protein DinB